MPAGASDLRPRAKSISRKLADFSDEIMRPDKYVERNRGSVRGDFARRAGAGPP
jgi:hypothetical protein